jgi:hypothetical protein
VPEEPRRISSETLNAINASLDEGRLLQAEHALASARWQQRHNQLLAENGIRTDGAEIIDDDLAIVRAARPEEDPRMALGAVMARAHAFPSEEPDAVADPA